MSRLNHRLAKLEKVCKQAGVDLTVFKMIVSPDTKDRIVSISHFSRGVKMTFGEDETEGAFLSRYYRAIAPAGPPEEGSDHDLAVLVAGNNEEAALLLANKQPIPHEVLESIVIAERAANGA